MSKGFEYAGYHFIPQGRFLKEENDFFRITKRLLSNTELGLCNKGYPGCKKPYTHKGFYEASTDKKSDIFLCVETEKLYVPCQYELMEYTPPKGVVSNG